MTQSNIRQGDVLADLRQYPDHHFHTMLGDPPYQMGTKWFIDPKDGAWKVKGRSQDFMNKWDGLDEKFMAPYFQESFRTLKHGGYLIIYAMDRQLGPLHYYATMAGFEICQSLYWYFLSNMPKATDAGKQIDKFLGLDRKVTGVRHNGKGTDSGTGVYHMNNGKSTMSATVYDTAPASALAQELDGYKYGVAPLKQVVETIIVLRKPSLNETILADLLDPANALISPSVLSIDANRVPTEDDLAKNYRSVRKGDQLMGERVGGFGFRKEKDSVADAPVAIGAGRFPAQMFVDAGAAMVLDQQSGSCGAFAPVRSTDTPSQGGGIYNPFDRIGDNGRTFYGAMTGASKILHQVAYEESADMDLCVYEAKAGAEERVAGLATARNPHPTIKPIDLNCKIASLFKLPDSYNQRWYVPFAGVRSEVIGIHKAGVPLDQIYGAELSAEFVAVGAQREAHWAAVFAREKSKGEQLNLF